METCRQACLPGTACRAPAKKHGRSISGDRQADQAGVVTFSSTSRRAGTANGGGKPPHSTYAVPMLELWLNGNVSPSMFAGHGMPCPCEEAPAIHFGGPAGRPSGRRYVLQHVPASRDGKRRRQAAALHTRCADAEAVADWKRIAKHVCRARSAAANAPSKTLRRRDCSW